MTDQQYIEFMAAHLAAAFYPPFGGTKFFNRDLFDSMLEQVGADVNVLNREMEEVNRRWSGPGQSAKLRADNQQTAVKLKIYTPSGGCKVTITADGVIQREMEPHE